MSLTRQRLSFAVVSLLVASSAAPESLPDIEVADPEVLIELGQALFFDANLSRNRSQSCATCHDPARAFSDSRDNGVGGAASLGDDGASLGDRNAPAISYVGHVPGFTRDAEGEFGGLFVDGRAASLEQQPIMPMLDPLEMAMPEEDAVVERVRENEYYEAAMRTVFGDEIFSSTETALRGIGTSIAAFERTALFQSFDSRYDRYLRGEIDLTIEEELGRVLFFSQIVNCSSCHLLDTREFVAEETFTNHRYHNIGVPANEVLRAANGSEPGRRDVGLLSNPGVHESTAAGKFRVPSLRNVAVTAPYMHNGVFRELETAIRFYNRYTLSNELSQVNPETGKPWRDAEVPETIDFELLREGQPLAENHIAALEAFLRALTDRRYEHLLE